MIDEISDQLQKVLSGLTDFQRATVDSVLEKYRLAEHSHRALVADEVGLGKTIVAKGIIAQLLMEHLSNTPNEPMRVIYICSNLALADENRQKLSLFNNQRASEWVKPSTFGRIVELAVKKKGADDSNQAVIEVCTLTPSTSFNLSAGAGNRKERAILATLLSQIEPFKGYSKPIFALFKTNLIKNNANWEWELNDIKSGYDIDQDLLALLSEKLNKPCHSKILTERFDTIKEATLSLIRSWSEDLGETEETSVLFNSLRVEIRRLVARCCASRLEADLFILDEFQRFQSLTDQCSDSEETIIARQVFKVDNLDQSRKAKVLLLSATPFKAMTTLDDEEDESSHHEQLFKLLDFLSHNDVEFILKYESYRDLLHRNMLSLAAGETNIQDSNARAVETLLRTYISRTERGQISENFEQLINSNELCCSGDFDVEEIKSYQAIEALNSILPRGRRGGSLIEFAKSSPWAISFLNGYSFKEHFYRNFREPAVLKWLNRSTNKIAWLSESNINGYKLNVEQDTPNAKTKALTKIVFDKSPENLLWIPPSKPYYPLEGVFKGGEYLSKTLLFSSWAMVPKALSSLWTYEAERRVLKGKGKRPPYFVESSSTPLLRLEGKSTLNTWHLVYPCITFSKVEYAEESLHHLLDKQVVAIDRELAALKKYEGPGATNSDWYVLAPMLLDMANGEWEHVEQWFNTTVSRAASEGRRKHILKLQSYFDDENLSDIGKMPKDLAKVLAFSSLANPATCAMRTIRLLWGATVSRPELMEYSVRFAELTVRLFNHDYAAPIIKRNIKHKLTAGRMASPNWFKVLVYCAHGNFQSMLDEYCHLLSTSGSSLQSATSKIEQAMGIRSTSEQVHFWEKRKKAKDKSYSSMRCHFAVSLGNQKVDVEDGLKRVMSVRDAFNSPFRPFVLSSTSIGQEGLDFHWYCRRVAHWNLPNNPIDVEQREGRVNRYKSLVVRQRIAQTYNPRFRAGVDKWQQLFEQAKRTEKNKRSDLEPYWFFSKGSAQIERVVPTYPMSKEVSKYAEIKKILVLYRLAFGQPRQQELLDTFSNCDIDSSEFKSTKDALIIDLAPLNFQQ